MAAITKGTKCFSKSAETLAYKEYFFPSQLNRQQTFSGNISGASEPPKNKTYFIGDYLGDSEGHIEILGGVEYQLIKGKGTIRQLGGFLGLGAGQYIEVDELIYVESTNISIDEVWATEQKNNRVNKKEIEAKKALDDKNKLLAKIADDGSKPDTGNRDNLGTFNLTSIVLIVFTFIGLIIGGVLWWKGKQNKQQAKQSANGVI